jgi:hypothetical protein
VNGVAATLLLLATPQSELPLDGFPPRREPPKVAFATGYHFWMTGLDFSAATASTSIDIEAGALQGAELSAAWSFEESWSARLGLEAGFGLDMHALVASLGAAWRPGWLDAPWEASVRAAFLVGALDVEDVPGDFENGLGLEAGAGISRFLADWAPGLSVGAEVALRFLEFDFDGDPGVVRSDDAVGGFGVRLFLGLDYRF